LFGGNAVAPRSTEYDDEGTDAATEEWRNAEEEGSVSPGGPMLLFSTFVIVVSSFVVIVIGSLSTATASVDESAAK